MNYISLDLQSCAGLSILAAEMHNDPPSSSGSGPEPAAPLLPSNAGPAKSAGSAGSGSALADMAAEMSLIFVATISSGV